MKIMTKIGLASSILNIFLGAIAAQECFQYPVQEPIGHEMQPYKLAGYAFMAGHHPRLGERSVVSTLPPDVARDIVKLAKPKEEFGFIRNYTDKTIKHLGQDGQRNSVGCHLNRSIPFISSQTPLAPQHQIRFIKKANEVKIHGEDYFCNLGYNYCIFDSNSWNVLIDPSDDTFDVSMDFNVGTHMKKCRVRFFELMNLSIYQEDEQTIRLEVTSPNHPPLNYNLPWYPHRYG